MTTGTRHHILPQFYLNNFAHPKGKDVHYIYMYSKNEQPRSLPVSKIARIKHYYSVTLEDGTKDTNIEKLFGQLENSVAPIIKNLQRRDKKLLTFERELLLEFMAYMATRIPSFRNMIENAQLHTYKIISSMMYHNENLLKSQVSKLQKSEGKEIGLSLDEIRELFDDNKYPIEVNPESSLEPMAKAAQAIFEMLTNMGWHFIRSENYQFLTSDNPVIPVVPESDGRMPVGFGMKNVEVTFPLSSNMCMIGGYNESDSFEQVRRETVQEINKRTISHAKKYLFAPFLSNEVRF